MWNKCRILLHYKYMNLKLWVFVKCKITNNKGAQSISCLLHKSLWWWHRQNFRSLFETVKRRDVLSPFLGTRKTQDPQRALPVPLPWSLRSLALSCWEIVPNRLWTRHYHLPNPPLKLLSPIMEQSPSNPGERRQNSAYTVHTHHQSLFLFFIKTGPFYVALTVRELAT